MKKKIIFISLSLNKVILGKNLQQNDLFYIPEFWACVL